MIRLEADGLPAQLNGLRKLRLPGGTLAPKARAQFGTETTPQFRAQVFAAPSRTAGLLIELITVGSVELLVPDVSVPVEVFFLGSTFPHILWPVFKMHEGPRVLVHNPTDRPLLFCGAFYGVFQ